MIFFGSLRSRAARPAARAGWLLGLALSAAACASATERGWQKADATPAALQRDESECLTAAGIERVPRAHAGTAAMPGRDADSTARGYTEYVRCMEGRGYTRSGR